LNHVNSDFVNMCFQFFTVMWLKLYSIWQFSWIVNVIVLLCFLGYHLSWTPWASSSKVCHVLDLL